MQEDFLHYVWQYKKLDVLNLRTTSNASLQIVRVGEHNLNSGPDFFNAQLRIGGQLWAGNVEVHIKSSDWFAHDHETDKAYDNVILHVVWEHDVEVYRNDNSEIPTLEIKSYLDRPIFDNYKKLFSKQKKWINCESDFANVDTFVLDHWLERLYFERLERKSKAIEEMLEASKQDWEAVLFKLLAKNFGLKVNGDAFLSLARSIDFSMVRKVRSNLNLMEALLFGQAGLLDDDVQDHYYRGLAKEYQFLKHKFQLNTTYVLPIQFFRLRPANFPTIRLAQLAMLYHQHQNLFSKVVELTTRDELYDLFKISTSTYWETHYNFGKVSKASVKSLTKSFIDLVLINTILPLKFCYAKHTHQQIDHQIIDLSSAIDPENNAIINAFNSLKKVTNSALQSQALLQLKSEYCDKNKCLQCAVGNALIIK